MLTAYLDGSSLTNPKYHAHASINFREVSQLSVLLTVCTQCESVRKLDKMANHVCLPKPPKPANCHCKICSTPATQSTSPQSNLDPEIIKATQLLKSKAIQHSKGTPIPKEIEAASDAWTWLKLLTTDRVAQLKTPGRVSIKVNLYTPVLTFNKGIKVCRMVLTASE